MQTDPIRRLVMPREADLGLRRIANAAGLGIACLPNGSLFAIEHRHERGRTLVNQIQGAPLDGGIGRLFLRLRAPEPVPTASPGTARPPASGTQSSSGSTPRRRSGSGA